MNSTQASVLLAATLLGAVAVSPTAAFAQSSPADPNADHVKPGTYRVEPAHTQIIFGVSHLGFTEYRGRLTGVEGTLRLDPQKVGEASLDVTVPVASISTASDKLDGELKSAAWLDAGQFPQARFRSVHVVQTAPGQARIDGELTLHGVTQPVTLQARFIGAGTNPLSKAYTVGFEATGHFNRSAFGVKTYIPLIGDEVTLTLAGAFEASS